MSRFLFLLGMMPLVAACESGPDGDFAGFEVCGDGIDNNGNGLVDCEDEAACAPCQDVGDGNDDTGIDRPDLSVEVPDDGSCDFVFGAADCNRKEVCEIVITNRSEDDGRFGASCTNETGEKDPPLLLSSSLEGRANTSLTNQDLDDGQAVRVTIFSTCNFLDSYSATCSANLQVDDERVDGEIDIQAVFTK